MAASSSARREVRLALDDARAGDEHERAPAADGDVAHGDRVHGAIIGGRGGWAFLRSGCDSGHRLGRRPLDGVRRLVLVARLDERGEQRMRPRRLRLELRMELHGEIPRMAGQLGDLDELAVGRAAGDPQAVLGERPLVEAVELVAVAVTLVNRARAVDALGERARASARRRRCPAASCRRGRRRRADRAACRSPWSACRGCTRSSRRRPGRRRCARTRPSPTGSRSRCRSRESALARDLAPPSSCRACRGRRSRPARECRRRRRAALAPPGSSSASASIHLMLTFTRCGNPP